MTVHRDRGDDDLAGWVDEPPRRRVRLAVVVALAAVPWVVVAAAVLRPAPPPPPPTAASGADASAPRTAPAAPGDPRSGASEEPEARPGDTVVLGTVLDGGARGVPTPDELGAVAVVVGRAFAQGDGAPLAAGVAPSSAAGYVEHLVVEAVDAPSPELAVVTLLAVVLHAEDGVYRHADLRRLGVPLAVGPDGVRPAGTPWWLPVPALELATPELTPLTDPDLHLAVAEAVTAAGYRDVAVTSVARTPSWALVADVDAAAPGGDTRERYVLWLRRHLDGLLVAGTRPAARGAGAPPGAPSTAPPSGDPSPEPEVVP